MTDIERSAMMRVIASTINGALLDATALDGPLTGIKVKNSLAKRLI